MNDSDVDELGPVDYLVVEFPADKANFSGEMAHELSGLVERDLARSFVRPELEALLNS